MSLDLSLFQIETDLRDLYAMREEAREAVQSFCCPACTHVYNSLFLWGPRMQMIADNGQDCVSEDERITRMRGVGAQL